MIVVVAPEPAAWIAPTVAALAAIDQVAVWAPWTMAARWTGLPGAAGRFARRRQLAIDRPSAATATATTAPIVDGQPGWPLVQAAARAWAGERVDRRYQVAFAERVAVDAWAARRIARLPIAPRAVVACTGAALRTFAAAAARGATTVLVADLPWLRRLHDDLDRAAAALPDRAFLRRFRAPRPAVVRQEMERTLAGLIAVRGHYAADTCVAAGVAADRLIALPGADEISAPGPASALAYTRRTLVLAGLATARTGLDAALAARDRHPELVLRIRTGDGTEPADVLTRAGVVAHAPAGPDPLDDAVAVLAPSWCETYAPELARAAARGIPIIATRAGAGFTPATLVEPGDHDALTAAIAAVRTGTFTATAAARPRLLPHIDSLLSHPGGSL